DERALPCQHREIVVVIRESVRRELVARQRRQRTAFPEQQRNQPLVREQLGDRAGPIGVRRLETVDAKDVVLLDDRRDAWSLHRPPTPPGQEGASPLSG